MEVTDWHGLYSGGWQGVISPEAFSHPAKFSRKLIEHIYEHAVDEGWLVEGSTVIDPFAGVGLGAWPALPRGINWIGCELEEKFVKLGRENLALWDGRYRGKMPRWGNATLLQGDSRQLAQVLGEAALAGVVSSPPYTGNALGHGRGDAGKKREATGKYKQGYTQGELTREYYGIHPAQLGNMPEGSFDGCISSPPHGDSLRGTKSGIDWGKQADRETSHPHGYDGEGYSASPENLGNMPEGSIDMALSSPPYAEAQTGGTKIWDKLEVTHHRRFTERSKTGGYVADLQGKTPGQLAAMPSGSFQAVVSSPPWEESLSSIDLDFIHNRLTTGPSGSAKLRGKIGARSDGQVYGNANGQLGQESGSTFWQAARVILEQTYQVLAPSAHAIWVVKAFVRKKKLVDFPGQWRQLCESVGFETLHQHRAWLVEDRGSQYGLDGMLNHRRVERKSFFRRLAERKGSPRIDYEVVLCMTKPNPTPTTAFVPFVKIQ